MHFSDMTFLSYSVQEVESECMEFWDWLLDMEATVQNSLGLLVSEEQHLQMCKVDSYLLNCQPCL